MALVLVLLLVLPALFSDQVEQRAKAEVNQALEARIDWRDTGLGLFRNFPNLTLTLDDLSAVGRGRFDGDTLATVDHFRVVLDLFSVVRSMTGGGSPIVVRAVELDRPRISLLALEDGTANWDITKKTPSDTAPAAEAGEPMAVSLRRLRIDDAAISFDNRAARLRADVKGFRQSLSGDFGGDRVVLETDVHADSVTVEFAGIPYLNGVRLDVATAVEADLAGKAYTLRETEVRLNDLALAFAGTVAAAGERLGLDLSFKAPQTDFRHILSLVPAIYARDFQSVRTTGTVAVSGRVKGQYGEDAFPAFGLELKVDDGSFRYPDLPLPARDIFVDLTLSNPGGDVDSTVVQLKRLHLVLGREPIDAALVLRTPVSDPDVDASLKGKLDLADVRRTVKLEGIEELSGTVAADAAVRARMSWLENKQYDKVSARGSVDVAGLTLKGEELPRPLTIREAALRLAPERAELRSFTGTIGSSDLRMSGRLDNLLGYALRDETLRGTATVNSSRFVLDEWRSEEETDSVIPVPAGLDFTLEAAIGELLYDKLKMTDARGRVQVKDQRITLENFSFNTLGGKIGITGFYETTTPSKPAFDVGMSMQTLDIPSAVEAFTTVKLLAPVARYAQGNFSADLKLNGALAGDMSPVFEALNGRGSLQTSKLLIQDFPALEKVAEATKLRFLNDPTVQALRSRIEIRDGRLHVEPFDVGIGPTTMKVAGSNGLDQSLAYGLSLEVPRSELGSEANEAVAGLIARAGRAGIDLSAAPAVALGVQLAGTVTNPSVKLDVGSAAGSVKQEATRAAEAVGDRAAEVADEARRQALAEGERLVREAEAQAATIRQEAQALAETVKREGYQQADALVEKSSNPLARAAAGVAADKLRRQTDEKSAGIIREADERANALVAEARRKAGDPPP